MKKLVLFLTLFLLSPLTSADPHSHDKRVHDHPYPAAGVKHRHGAGGLGVAESANQKPASPPQKTVVKAKKKDGYYYYSLVGKEMKVKNYKGAVSLLTKSCNLNYGLACAKLGLFHGAGRGVPKNNSTAQKFFSKSCSLNNGDGCYNYGLMSRCKGVVSSRTHGECSLASMRNSRDYFINRACKAGQSAACKMISDKYPFDPSGVMHKKMMTETYSDGSGSSSSSDSGSSSSASSSGPSMPKQNCQYVTRTKTVHFPGSNGGTALQNYTEKVCN